MAPRAGAATARSHDHVVKVYDDDSDLVREVAEYVVGGIAAGDLVVLVTTPAHRGAEVDADAKVVWVDLAPAAGPERAVRG